MARTAIVRSVSFRPSQLERLSKEIDLSWQGEFSRFIQKAVDEKLDRLYAERNPQTETQLKAS